jgi:phosphate transport system protein
MPRERFGQQLDALTAATVVLGEQAATAVLQSVQAFLTFDSPLAMRVVDEDAAINRMERQVLDDAALLLTLQAPVASDLRRILGVSRVASDLERIGDHARNIAQHSLRLAAMPDLGGQGDLDLLIAQTSSMLREGLRAYAESDVELARAVSQIDNGVDAAYASLFRSLMGLMVEDTSTVARATYTLLVAHDIERIADHVVSIAESVVYVVTGETTDLS